MNINSIVYALCALIPPYLNAKELKTLSCLSRTLRRYIIPELDWSVPTIRIEAFLASIRRRGTSLRYMRSLTLYGGSTSSFLPIQSLSVYLPQLDHLTLRDLTANTARLLDTDKLADSPSGSINLETLTIRGVYSSHLVLHILFLCKTIEDCALVDVAVDDPAPTQGQTATMQRLRIDSSPATGTSLPRYLPRLLQRTDSLTHLNLTLRTSEDLVTTGRLLHTCGGTITHLVLDLWTLEMTGVDFDYGLDELDEIPNETLALMSENDKDYLIEPTDVLSWLEEGLRSCRHLSYLRIRGGSVFSTQVDPRHADIFKMLVCLVGFSPRHFLRHIVLNLNDTKSRCPEAGRFGHRAELKNPWVCDSVDWQVLRDVCASFPFLVCLELLAENEHMHTWAIDAQERVRVELRDFPVSSFERHTQNCDEDCVHTTSMGA